MKRIWRPFALLAALAFVALSFINASWLAPGPRGNIKLIAHRGVMQLYGRASTAQDGCTATKIEPPHHEFIENTIPGIDEARRNGARMIELDIAPTSDGKIALFHDQTLDCRTNGKGPVSGATLAQLKALDAGYGYSADGGKSFPLRGKGVGLIPALPAALTVIGDGAVLYNLRSKDAAAADLLIAALKSEGRDVLAHGDGFSVHEPLQTRLRAAFPKAWIYGDDSIRACTRSYLMLGWLGITPEVCRGGTIAIPLNYQWAFAGWPNRLIARMQAVGARVIVVGPYEEGTARGLDLPEQIRGVPASFNGYLWTDDIRSVGPALRPALNRRNPPQEAALAAALERRRAARD